MPYKISGTLNNSAKVIVIKESDWSVETTADKTAGAYEVNALVSGTKTVVAVDSEGEVEGYGNLTPVYYE